MNDAYYDLVARATFPPTDAAFLLDYAPEEMWKSDVQKACHAAIRNCPAIDWRAYLANNPDVAAADVDPCEHFLRDGIFEARRLYIKRSDCKEHKANSPKISIIMPNYNNEIYLCEAIDSITNQTLKDIELIVVDDASTDNSINIIKDKKSHDNRIRLIESPINCSQHMARKKGIATARGEFIMFLDSDDTYHEKACEISYEAIIKGYDLVVFNGQIMKNQPISSDTDGVAAFMKSAYHGASFGGEIMRKMFGKRVINRYINTKIFSSWLTKTAFNRMKDGFFPLGEDEYEMYHIVQEARSVFSINESLYFRRPNVGYSSPKSSRAKTSHYIASGELANIFASEYRQSGGEFDFQRLYNSHLRNQISFWLRNDDINNDEFFNVLVKQHGITTVLERLINDHKNSWSIIASKVPNSNNIPINKNIKNIAVLYANIGDGGADNVLINFCNALVSFGYCTNLILSRCSKNNYKLDKKINIYYVNSYYKGNDDLVQHIRQLNDVLLRVQPDVLINHNFEGEQLIWQIILARSMGVPIIVFQHVAFYHRLLLHESSFGHQDINNTLRCADKVICLSEDAEAYYRSIGINAEAIYNPVKIASYTDVPFKQRKNTIIYVSRLGDPLKQDKEALRVIREVVKKRPALNAIFIGSFGSQQEEENFIKVVEYYQLDNNVKVTGWISDPGYYADQAALLLSTSYTESFSLAMAEAQAHGLPCVAYELPLTITTDNESIIQVDQGDHLQAAKEIITLLDDEDRWERLSKIARLQASAFDPTKFNIQFCKMLHDFQFSSPVHWYDSDVYERIIRTINFYAGQLPPK